MLDSVIEGALAGIRSSASEIAWQYGCVITSTLDMQISEFPVFSQDNKDGLLSSLRQITSLVMSQRVNYGRIRLVEKDDPPHRIGITSSGRPKILVMPGVVKVPANGGYSTGFVSAVGVYALHPTNRRANGRVYFGVPLPRAPYNEM